MLKILFYDAKSYDKDSFNRELANFPEIQIDYLKSELGPSTAKLAKGYDAVCAFVSCDVGTETVEILHQSGVGLILMRCAGFNNVDIEKAKACGIRVLRVPGYSPEAVAEHAMALALAANRKIHKAYVRVRENDFSLGGMLGRNFLSENRRHCGNRKDRRRHGPDLPRLRHEGDRLRPVPEPVSDFVTYVTMDELLAQSDLISLHCPLTDETYHLISRETIQKMKDGVILVNTSGAVW